MSQKSQVLIIFLWVLVALAVITLSLGDRIFIILKFANNRKSLLKADRLAYAGVNFAIAELKKDNPDFDSLTDAWADNQDAFEKIRLTENPLEYATIANEGKFGVIDEERKININKASKELLLALLEYYEIPAPQEIANNLLIWRGDSPDNEMLYDNLGYPAKARPFANIAELMLVKGIDAEAFNKIHNAITVYGNGGININTAPEETIEILCRSLAKQNNANESSSKAVADEFLSLRNAKLAFKDKAEITLSFTDSDELNIFNEFLNTGQLKSENFLIEVKGNTGKIKSKVSIVYNRKDNSIKSYYEG
ncbi:MAG: hypothetical protein V1869_06365 [Candidatus Omnitrophota bacterium]